MYSAPRALGRTSTHDLKTSIRSISPTHNPADRTTQECRRPFQTNAVSPSGDAALRRSTSSPAGILFAPLRRTSPRTHSSTWTVILGDTLPEVVKPEVIALK